MNGAYLVAGAFGLLAGAFIILNMYNARKAADFYKERNQAREQRDRLNRENDETNAQLQTLVGELWDVTAERDGALKARDEAFLRVGTQEQEIARLKQQLADVQYEVKTPRTRTARGATLKGASNTAGNDGER